MFRRLSRSKCTEAATAAVVVALAGAAPGSALAADEPTTDVSPAAASEILQTAEATVAPQAAPADAVPAVDATTALHDVALALPALEGAERRRARNLLARPTDGQNDPIGDGYPPAAPIASAHSDNFCVFWVNAQGFPDAPDLTDANGSADGDGVPDYVESLLAIAEYSRSIEVAPGVLGWEPPKRDKEGCGSDPSARADIYLKQLGNDGLFGYQTVDPGQGRNRSQYGYMVLDDDYARTEYGYEDPSIPASVTFAHEFNHLLQVNYDTFQDSWMLEATATWVEEKVYPEINDYLGYVAAFADYPHVPVTELFPPGQKKALKIYGAAVWNHWLDGGGGGYGAATVRRAWELSDETDPPDFALAAYDTAVDQAGGRGFGREWAAFTAATAEWRTGFGGFPDAASYPDVRRKGSLSKGREREFKLDHTAYRLLDVDASGGKLKLKVKAEEGVRSALALIGRDGDALGGQVTRKLRYLKKGGSGSVTLEDAGRFERITALVVNADERVKGFDGGDWNYTRDDRSFRVELAG
jgi:hypothetical protein